MSFYNFCVCVLSITLDDNHIPLFFLITKDSYEVESCDNLFLLKTRAQQVCIVHIGVFLKPVII